MFDVGFLGRYPMMAYASTGCSYTGKGIFSLFFAQGMEQFFYLLVPGACFRTMEGSMSACLSLCLRDVEVLFRPFHHRKLVLPSRVVMAPMNRCCAIDGVPSLDMAPYYRRRAEQELGLIITEGALVDDPAAAADEASPNFFGGAALRAWKAICTAVHATGCKMIPQLLHAGMVRPRAGGLPHPEQLPIGPSGIDPVSLQCVGEPMGRGRMAAVIDSFARGAAHAKALGFDGVEIQGAHGYLVDQFLWAATNRRSDEYGGDHVGRTRFACELVRAVRKAVGRRFPIFFRFSQWKIGHDEARLAETPAQLEDILLPLCDAGVDIFDCSSRSCFRPEFEGSPLNLAGWVRRLTGRPAIASGTVGIGGEGGVGEYSRPVSPAPTDDLRRLCRMLDAGEFDLVAVGRALLADPAWARKCHLGQEASLTPFTRRSLGRLI